MFSWCFLSVSRYFNIVRNLSREPDFSAEDRIFKNFSKSLKTCLAGGFWVFHGILALFDIWAENRIFQPRIGFSKNFLKCLKACLVGVFWVFQSISSIVRHLGREPDFSAENRIFKNFLKSLKTCLVGVFWVFQGILAQFEICAENHIFEPRTEFSRIFQKASKHVLLVFSGCFNVSFLALFDIWAENRIFVPRTVFSKHFFKSL